MNLATAPQAGRSIFPPDHDQPIRLMIVDDSPVARAVLSRMIGQQRGFEVVALAHSAAEALKLLRSIHVDIVLLDLEMPEGSGLEALPRILEEGRGAQVLIVSSMAEAGAQAAVRALALGASDTLPKPGAGIFAGRFAEILADRLRRIGRARRDSDDADGPASGRIRLRALREGPVECLALGASTGGLHALNSLLRALPAQIGIPILVTQHLPALFMPFFARQLAEASGRQAVLAEDRQPLRPDQIHVAPGTAHLTLERRGSGVRVRLDNTPTPSGCLPSLDPMFEAVAETYGPAGLGVVLSGMGRDGTRGGEALVAAGGTVFAQDRASSAIWGMPRSAAEAGLASAVAAPAELARRAAALVEVARCR